MPPPPQPDRALSEARQANPPRGSLQRNTLYNMSGSIFSVCMSLLTVPLYLHLVGDTRYGMLAIVWLLLGYFGVFDMGISRAVANEVARQHAAPAVRAEVFWTSLWMNCGFGVIGGLALYALSAPILMYFLKISDGMRHEILSVLPWLAAAVPLATISGVFSGALEGREQFLRTNMLQAIGTAMFQLIPLAVAWLHGPDLGWLVPAALLARTASVVPLWIAAMRAVPAGRPRRPTAAMTRRLLSFGAWVTVSNLISPLLTSIDRFVIGSMLGPAAIAYYTVPFNLAARVGILPGALLGALFPQLAAKQAAAAFAQSLRSLQFLGVIMTPLTIIGILLMHPFLSLWVGAPFAARAAPVGALILLGIWTNSLAFVPFGLLQAQGRPDVAAKFHVVEIVPFLGILWLCVTLFGLEGAALAWSVRVSVDMLLLFWAGGFRWQHLSTLWPALPMLGLAWVCSVYLWPWSLAGLCVEGGLVLASAVWAFMREPVIGSTMIDLRRRLLA
jgi:O-antigen/teichoic acid export membrane protein